MKTILMSHRPTTFKAGSFRPMPKSPPRPENGSTQRMFSPRPLAGPISLGQDNKFQFSELPKSIGLGLLGAGGLVIGASLPSPLKEMATVAGLGTVAYAVLNLFSGEAPAEEGTESGEAFPSAPGDQFGQVTAKIIKPTLGESVSRGAFSYDYDVEVLWTNHSEQPVSVPYRIYVEEDPQGSISTPFKGVVYTGLVNLKGKESVVKKLEIDLQSSGVALATGITLKIQKLSSAGQAFNADQRFFVVS